MSCLKTGLPCQIDLNEDRFQLFNSLSFFQAALASSGTRLANATTAAFKAKVAAAEDKKKARITIYKDETNVIKDACTRRLI